MGFRTGAFAKVWKVEPRSDTNVSLRISISRKNKQSGEYEQDFSGFVSAIGTAAAKRAAVLKEGDTIKLGDVDVTNRYDKKNGEERVFYKVFSFEAMGGKQTTSTVNNDEPQPTVDSGEVDDSRLPF